MIKMPIESSADSPLLDLPLVSVVVEGSTDVSASVVHHTVTSLAEQTYPSERIEIIFMGASPEGRAGARVNALLPRSVVIPASDLRYYDMKNVGAEHATGEIVAFIDSDVTWNPEWLSCAVQSLAGLPPYSAVVGLTRYLPGWFSDAGTVSQFGYHWYKYATQDYDDLLGVIANNFAVRHKEFLDVRYRHTAFRQGMDIVLASDLQERGGKVQLNPALRAMHKWGRSKVWEHPQTAYNVGRGLTTAVRNCDWLLRTEAAQTHVAQLAVRVNPEWLLNGSFPAVLALVTVRFWLFHTYLRRTRKVLGVPQHELVPNTLFLAAFFSVVAYDVLSHRRPALGDGRTLVGRRSTAGSGEAAPVATPTDGTEEGR